MNINEYFKSIEEEVKKNYDIAGKAKEKGLDPSTSVEVPVATSLAERVLGLVSVLYPQINDKRIVERVHELEKQYGPLDPAVSLTIAEEIAKEKFCKFKSHHEAMEAGVRVAIGYLTLGYVSSPIEGFMQLKLKKTAKGEDYIAPYYSGPIRSAGGTEAAFSLVIIDYLREMFGYARYDPTEDEVKRGIHECYEYHERITNLQYLPSEQELDFLLRNIPIQITGDPSEDKEVFNYKDLPRIETNFIRSGFTLVTGEGLAQKAPKILKRVVKLRERGFKLTDWDWLAQFVDLQKKIKESKGKGDASRAGATYIQDLVGGRPVFAHPSESGAFRLRYGRARNTGYSTLALHPATMAVTDGFIAVGTQLKIEMPTKGCTIAACDTIEGPIVKLNDESVVKLKDHIEARKIYPQVKEIIYLGDLLVPYGDFANRNHVLEPAGYEENYWMQELKKAGGESELFPTLEKARELSEKYKVSLHPEFIFYWREIGMDSFFSMLDLIAHGQVNEGKLILPYSKNDRERFMKGKRALELIGCEHIVSTENIVLNTKDSSALFVNLGIEDTKDLGESVDKIVLKIKRKEMKTALDAVREIATYEIRDKSGTFIGARMGRPEKAKLRKLTGSPHVLFPVGDEGGRLRSIMAAAETGKVTAEFCTYFCNKCEREEIYPKCIKCGEVCEKKSYRKEFENGEKSEPIEFSERAIDVKSYIDDARKILGLRNDEIPSIVKGVRGTSSKDHSCEHLAKGILRTRNNLHVNKDGTIRYDMTEMPITHFRPAEIGTSVARLRELGYEKDFKGNELRDDNQILEMFPHDIILPASPESPDERADDVLLRISKFLDDEFEKLYGMPRLYNAVKREDLIGVLLGCMSPHTSATAVGRLIGFSKVQALLASPYIHAAMRRDCFDYDSYIPIKKDGFWEIEKIGNVVEKVSPSKIVDNFGTKEVKVEGFETLGVGKNVCEVKINNFTKHAKRNMIEIKTALGKKIRVTENHKFLIGNKIKRAEEIIIGDEIPSPIEIKIKEKDIKEINLASFFNGNDFVIREINNIVNKISDKELEGILRKLKISRRQFSNFKQRDSFPVSFVENLNETAKEKALSLGRISKKRDRISIPAKIKISPELLEVIGLYIAEGYSRSVKGKKGLNQVYIASNDENIREFVKKTIFSHFGLKPSERKEDRVTFSSSLLYLFFNDFLKCGSCARDKRIPYLFLGAPKKKLACILRGYFEGDGSAEKDRMKVSCDSISEGLLYDLEFCLGRFGIFAKRYEYEKEPGEIVKKFYEKKGRKIPKFKITKLIIGSDFVRRFNEIGFLSKRKINILKGYEKMKPYGMKIRKNENFVFDPVVSIENIGEKESYCLNVDNKNHLVLVNSLVSRQCDGDEAAIMMLMDLLLNFSRKFIPSHRGGTQDAPLVLNMRIRANEVDDMIFDLDTSSEIPLELYVAAEKKKHPSEVKMPQIKERLGKDNEFTGIGFSHDTSSINLGPFCSSYKTLPTMGEKIDGMMLLCSKIRAVDTSDVARLIIERHFIRDTRGNLRKFSMQGFRCVGCNEKFRRPPLAGKCNKCGGKIIFTISEGSVLKYMQKSLDLAREYNVSPYLLESLELTEKYIHSIFGKEKEKQEALGKWFN